MHYIYGLLDPRDGQLRYIGKTNSLETRYANHCNGGLTGDRRDGWVRELKGLGLLPKLQELEAVEDTSASDAENFYIGYFRMLGANLTNGETYNYHLRKRERQRTPANTRWDADLLDQIDAAARRRGLSRTAWLHYACGKVLEEGGY